MKPLTKTEQIIQKYWYPFVWGIILCLIACSCSSTLRTGYYKVTDVRGNNTVNFSTLKGKAIEGDYHFPDTVKIGDTVYLKRTFKIDRANVW